ncbi:MAG: hypothetical protein ACFBZ8_05740 [Opitutales bacterium]
MKARDPQYVPEPQEPIRTTTRAPFDSSRELLRRCPQRTLVIPGGAPQHLAQLKRLRAGER